MDKRAEAFMRGAAGGRFLPRDGRGEDDALDQAVAYTAVFRDGGGCAETFLFAYVYGNVDDAPAVWEPRLRTHPAIEMVLGPRCVVRLPDSGRNPTARVVLCAAMARAFVAEGVPLDGGGYRLPLGETHLALRRLAAEVMDAPAAARKKVLTRCATGRIWRAGGRYVHVE